MFLLHTKRHRRSHKLIELQFLLVIPEIHIKFLSDTASTSLQDSRNVGYHFFMQKGGILSGDTVQSWLESKNELPDT